MIPIPATLAYLILIFCIADIAHLGSHLIKLLTNHKVIWPVDLVYTNIREYGLSREVVKIKYC